jgi:hypothetical protein
MKMIEDEFQLNFPAGARIPDELPALLRFQNQSSDWYSGHFELDKWRFGNAAWFGDDAEAARQFSVIGHGPDGSLYALWTYSGRTLENAPVVFLGSEGTDNSLLAGSLRDFLALLAIGADELGFAASWGDVKQADPAAPRLNEFRSWLDRSLGIVAPEAPKELIASARALHPDFEAWLNSWFASRG